jgi:hypothetical protein
LTAAGEQDSGMRAGEGVRALSPMHLECAAVGTIPFMSPRGMRKFACVVAVPEQGRSTRS